MRFSVRRIKPMISRTSQCAALACSTSIDGDHRFGIADGADDHRADLRLVQPQPQQRIVELAERAHRPRTVAGLRRTRRRIAGCGESGAEMVSSQVRFARSIAPFTYLY